MFRRLWEGAGHAVASQNGPTELTVGGQSIGRVFSSRRYKFAGNKKALKRESCANEAVFEMLQRHLMESSDHNLGGAVLLLCTLLSGCGILCRGACSGHISGLTALPLSSGPRP